MSANDVTVISKSKDEPKITSPNQKIDKIPLSQHEYLMVHLKELYRKMGNNLIMEIIQNLPEYKDIKEEDKSKLIRKTLRAFYKNAVAANKEDLMALSNRLELIKVLSIDQEFIEELRGEARKLLLSNPIHGKHVQRAQEQLAKKRAIQPSLQ